MGFMDDLKKLTKPYTEDDDDFDEFDDDARPSRPSRSSTAPKPSYSGFDLDNDDLSSSGSSSNTGRRTLGGSNASNGKVVNIHTTAQMQVVLVKPDRFDNVSDIAEHLRSKHAVVLNLESTNKDVARRLVDFLSGCAYALDGKIKKIAISTYIITPYNVDIVGDLIDELENNGVYPDPNFTCREAASMFTPQEIQEQTFSKAVFGGYDMQQVDDFLEPLTEDYITLYKENSVLKAKMKILVEKLEEYRAQETQQSSATAEAEAKSAQLLKQTQAKCAAMLQNAEVNAQANAQVNAANVQLAQLNQQIHAEQERLDYAKQTALNFISVIERDVQGHLGLLETLKSRDLTKEEAPAQPKSAHEKPYDWQADKTEPAPAPAPSVSTEKIASEISDNLEKLIGSEPETKTVSTPAPAKPAARPMHPESATIKFEDLKFGRNYDPTSSK